MVEIVSRRVAENEALHDCGNEKAHATARILQDSQQLLAGESDDAQHRVEHGVPQTSRLRVTARLPSPRRAVIAASIDMLGMITLQTFPARNMVCRRVT